MERDPLGSDAVSATPARAGYRVNSETVVWASRDFANNPDATLGKWRLGRGKKAT
jgi:hypothetical protein